MNLTLHEIALMCGGTLSTNSDTTLLINNVVIDSRLASDSTLLVAIKGDKNDGHDFVNSTLSSSICAALVNRSYYESKPAIQTPNLIYVDDTVHALGILAHNYRLRLSIPVVGITGSNGKTTVKEMLKSICEFEFGVEHVLATDGNFNNHIGMPLTLLKINQIHKVAIIEMGMNHSGELTYLSNLAKPTIAVINNIMLAHAGFFNDLSDIAKAKGEIFSGLTENGIAYINQTSPYCDLWLNHPGKNVYFGVPDSVCYIKHSGNNGELTLGSIIGEIQCDLKILGEHNKLNAMTAATLAIGIGCSVKSIRNGLNNYTGYKGRLEKKQAFNGAIIIDDSYNANPDSVKAAILAIKALPKPHWFIFADLKELGKFAHDSHIEIGLFAFEHGIDCLLTLGDETRATNSVFNGHKLHFTHIQDIVEYCHEHLPVPATLLVKGSNSMNLSQLVAKIVK
jgi:UDP-N-acetylmuramoyl-tripeptide--D-alanyl-D-alanine ligase